MDTINTVLSNKNITNIITKYYTVHLSFRAKAIIGPTSRISALLKIVIGNSVPVSK